MSAKAKQQAAQRARRRRRARKRSRGGPSPVLAALASSALSLPGLAGRAIAAEWPTLELDMDYKFSRYSEDSMDPSDVVDFGTATSELQLKRYEINSHRFSIGSPISDRIALDLDVGYESMSGATPWYIIPNADAEPLQVMSGASKPECRMYPQQCVIEEQRVDATLAGTYEFDRAQAGLGVGFSLENDYRSISGSLSGDRHFNEKNTTVSGSFGFSVDHLSPTDADRFPQRPDSGDKQSYSFMAGLSQVLGRSSAIQTSITYRHNRGILNFVDEVGGVREKKRVAALSDPYKLAYVAGATVGDSRPGTRNLMSWLTRYRHHVSKWRGTLHLDYRLFLDDWKMNSHTFEIAWFQDIFRSIQLIPSLRYYSQSQAYFYAPWYDGPREDGLYSSDYRLSPYGALSFRIKAVTRFSIANIDWIADVGYERYMSGGGLALGDVVVANPGLVSFNMLSVGLGSRF